MFDLVSPSEACEMLSISRNHLQHLINEGKLPYVDVSTGHLRKRYRFHKKDLEKFIEERYAMRGDNAEWRKKSLAVAEN